MLIYIISIIFALSGFFYLLGKLMDEAKCYVCNYYGDKFYMIESSNKKYRHYSCNHYSSKLTHISHGSEWSQ